MNKNYAIYSPVILPLTTHVGAGIALDNHRYDLSYQVYQERADRIRIESYYFRTQFDFDNGTTLKFQYLEDAISGASPTGALPGNEQSFLTEIEDVRTGVLYALSHQFGDHTVEAEFSRSSEDDYLSYGFALSDKWELNQKNTTFTYGVNYIDDQVTVLGLPDQGKKSYDLFAGVTQIIDKNTTVSINFTMGYSEGYLNDPYKLIQRNETINFPGIPPIPVVNVYSENRPDSRLRQVLQLEGKHFFEKANASLDVMLRFSNDDYGVFSQTAEVEWRQGVGDSWEINPFMRYYQQNAADFFTNTLNNIAVVNPPTYPDGSGPHYSSDYRLSSFNALSLGLRLRYEINENISMSAAYEYYTMSGQGSDQAPSQAYMDADIWTFGLNAKF
ncbi:MAG: DUF3570 domain-containing protein [Akkermansiaceae bacterium]|jgi:hypothetical protein|nr:DUF3570 domain-containing protein [Akkermansiaceae bacterium]